MKVDLMPAIAERRLALLDAARQGRSGAMAELLNDCQPTLKRYARRSCTQAEDAEEAVQMALWRLYKHVGALRAATALLSWLFRIVERECRRLLRLRSREVPLDESAAALIAGTGVPTELRLDLARAIESLPLPFREVLILRDVQELSAAEVALQLDLSVAAVKSRLHRARSQVREQLLASGYWRDSDTAEG